MPAPPDPSSQSGSRRPAEEQPLLEIERQARLAAEAAQRRLSFLSDATVTLASSLDSDATLQAVGRLAVPQLADWCVVELGPDGGHDRRVAVVHGDPGKGDMAQELARRLTADPLTWGAASYVRQTGRPELYPVVPRALLRNLARDEEDLHVLETLGASSAILVPLMARGAILGSLTLVAVETWRHFGPEDLNLAEDFAAGAAVALDNARLYEAGVDALHARDEAVEGLLAHARQQAAVAELGRRALSAEGFGTLLEEACGLVAQGLGVDCCGVFEKTPDGGSTFLRAGYGWKDGVGRIVEGAEHPLVSGASLAVADRRHDRRLADDGFLGDHGLVALLTTGIHGRERPFGSLAAFTRAPRRFDTEDLHFLQGAAGVVAAAADLERALAALRASEERFRALIENASDGIALVDRHGTILYASPSTTRVLGYVGEDLLGHHALEFVHGEDREAVRRILVDVRARPGASASLEYRVRHKDGSWRWVEAVTKNLLDEMSVRAIVANYRDVTDRKRAEEEIRHRAHHDPLTDLPNRILFGDRLGQAMAQSHRTGHGFALTFVDLDHLKQVNDAVGHVVGDQLLRAVAERLRSCVRETDTVARVGGDEFTIIMQDVARSEDVVRMAHKVLAAVSRPFLIGEHRLHVTVSLGIALYPFDGVEADTLLKNADNALYRAKELGRNTYQLCTPEMNQQAVERLRLEKGLREALDREELMLHYQPELDPATGRLLGVEALLRWQHPELGLLPAAAFVPLAESTRLILPIGEWALDTICRQVRTWQKGGLTDLRVAMNLSGIQFEQRNLARTVARVLRETGPDPRGLEVEITETVAMRDVDSARSMMRDLRELGVGIAIDDFGTGHSSLAALKRFPIQTLKIDQSFISDLVPPSDDAMLVRAIINMAHTLRLKVVAEGVETPEQLAFLRNERCDAVQGFLVGRPAPPEDIARAH